MLDDMHEQLMELLVKYSDKTLTKLPPKTVWRIKVDNRFITTKSGNSSWEKKTHAKNALRYHFYSCLQGECEDYCIEHGVSSYKEAHKLVVNVYRLFLKHHVEFVEVTG